MTWYDGQFTGEELAFRCHHCGDSQRHGNKAHCSVNIYTSVYHCYKCGASGRMNSHDMSMITRGLKLDFSKVKETPFHKTDDFLDTIAEKIRHGPGINRYSAADRYHFVTTMGEKMDVFKSVTPSGDVVGYHFRPEDKSKIRTFGQKMFILPSKVKYNMPWRLVEGPWDQMDPMVDVACMGFPSEAQVRALAGKSLIICPDGDVFEDYRKLRTFMNHILSSNDIFVEHVERLPPGVDPDDLIPSKRERLSLNEIRKMLTPKRTFFKPLSETPARFVTPEQIWAEIQANKSEEEFWS